MAKKETKKITFGEAPELGGTKVPTANRKRSDLFPYNGAFKFTGSMEAYPTAKSDLQVKMILVVAEGDLEGKVVVEYLNLEGAWDDGTPRAAILQRILRSGGKEDEAKALKGKSFSDLDDLIEDVFPGEFTVHASTKEKPGPAGQGPATAIAYYITPDEYELNKGKASAEKSETTESREESDDLPF